MRLYLVRHGQSESNLMKIHGGWLDVSLTEQGKQEAGLAGKLLNGIVFDKVYTSDQTRAMQTADIALPDEPKEHTSLLREICLGELEGRKPADCQAQYGEHYLIQKANRNFRDFGGENYSDHVQRAKAFLDMVATDEDVCIAAFCHEGTIKCMLDIVLQIGHWVSIHNIECANGSVTILDYQNKNWRLCQWNITESSHLGEGI